MAQPQTEIKNIIISAIRVNDGDTQWVSVHNVPYFDGHADKLIKITFHGQTRFTTAGWIVVEHPDLGTWQATQRGHGYRVGPPQRLLEVQ